MNMQEPLYGNGIQGVLDEALADKNTYKITDEEDNQLAAAVAAQKSLSPVVIEDAQAIDKSFPTFFHLYNAHGGTAYVL